MMIDLHIHTTHSDGTDNVIEILKQAQDLGLEYISITDHNTINAYKELETINICDYYKGKVIIGCEINTVYKNLAIEMLAYGFDYKKLESWLDKWFSKEAICKQKIDSFNKLKQKCIDAGLIISDNLEFAENEWPSVTIFDDIKSHAENYSYFEKEVWEIPGLFYRRYMSNPNSPFFVNENDTRPSIDEILENVHNAGGKVFFAHLYGYHMDKYEEYLDNLVRDYKIDGVETYYTIFGQARTNYLIEFCKNHKLLMSGGSDYHGNFKPQVRLGTGEGDLKVPNQEWLGYTSFKS